MRETSTGGSNRPRGECLAECQRCKELEGAVIMRSSLSARVLRKDGSVEDLGIIATKEVTDAFVGFVVDQLQTETSAFGDFKYHDSGTGVTAEDQTDTAMETATGEARTTGTQIEGATANIYKSVATDTYAGSFAITEHGLFNASSDGILMDRSVFSAINVTSGDKIEFTYELTLTAGG